MNNKSINLINKLTSGLHDQVASINEELVDGNTNEALEVIKTLQADLKQLRSNLLTDQI